MPAVLRPARARFRARRAALALAASVALAGCGSEDEQGGGTTAPPPAATTATVSTGADAMAIESAVVAYYAAVADGDAVGICEGLTGNAEAELAERYEGSDCAARVDAYYQALSEAQRATAGRVRDADIQARVAGDEATVTVAGVPGSARMIQKRRGWEFDTLPGPLP